MTPTTENVEKFKALVSKRLKDGYFKIVIFDNGFDSWEFSSGFFNWLCDNYVTVFSKNPYYRKFDITKPIKKQTL